MNKTKISLLPVISLLIAAVILAILPTEAEAMIYEDTVRLHIRAASDDERDQSIKLAVRDKMLSCYGDIMLCQTDADAASAVIEGMLPEIEHTLQVFCDDMGYGCKISAELSVEWFDTRQYESFTLPCGYYRSVIIKIDGGEGANWWCVMYPPLCLDIATGTGALSQSESDLISSSGYRVKFKVLEGLSGLFKRY